MNDPKVKQQIAEKIKDASNILVTVSSDPSVDELSAALGLTLLLNKMDKHATAIFSGKIPPAITFLDPHKTFESTTDSLRDFIIALDKEKADHLRYKLDGDLVKIFITPYRTTISGDDLEFSQGDYNVELVIALGVENKDHLDAALAGHGKILHDATVITLTAGEQVSNLGSIDWHNARASSLSEMLASLQETMKLDKKMLDTSIATAWLTGIVAATERFSNTKTSSRVMSIAANLMAAGADQQLIAARLDEAEQKQATQQQPSKRNKKQQTKLTEGQSEKVQKDSQEQSPQSSVDGALVIDHSRKGTLDEVAQDVGNERLAESARAAERALERHEEEMAVPVADPVPEIAPAPEVAPVPPAVDIPPLPAQDLIATHGQVQPGPIITPPVDSAPTGLAYGGTLNATTEQASEDKRREAERDKNKVILKHGYIGGQEPMIDVPINGVADAQNEAPVVDPFKSNSPTTPSTDSHLEPPSVPTALGRDITPPSQTTSQSELPAAPVSPFSLPPAPTPELPPAPAPQTLADLDATHRAPAPSSDDARAAVEAAFAASPAPEPVALPVTPAPEAQQVPPASEAPAAMGLPLPPPLPTDFSNGVPPLPPLNNEPERLGDIFPAPTPTPPPQPTDPGQFRIPGA